MNHCYTSVVILVCICLEVSSEFEGVRLLESSKNKSSPDNSRSQENLTFRRSQPPHHSSDRNDNSGSQKNNLMDRKPPPPPPRHSCVCSGCSGNSKKQSGWPLKPTVFDHPIQSPVDLLPCKAITMDLPELRIVEPDHKGSRATLLNNGHSVFVYINRDPSERPYIKGGPFKERYIFEQKHFHWGNENIWGSEHFLEGESFAAEIHMVHYNSKYPSFETAASKPDGLAVLTFFAEASNVNNSLLAPMTRLLDNITESGSYVTMDSKEAMQWAVSAFKGNQEYLAYPGSLTTPPYSENVVFVILPKPIKLSTKQLTEFRELHSNGHGDITDNKRNLQPLHGRPVVRAVLQHCGYSD